MPEVFKRLGNKCMFCGKRADTVDHIIPICWGGNNELENLQPCCLKCNSGKSGMLPEVPI
jgi:5-methylcytosine-specific restriction endonuclease McrA